MKNLPIYLFVLLPNLVFAQTPIKQWEKHYGSPWHDAAHALLQNMEGNLIFVGETKSRYKKGKEVYFVIADQSGNELFGKEYGREKDESANAVVQMPDGGYMVAGYSTSEAKGYQGDKDAWLLKIDKEGEVVWDTLLGSKNEDVFYDLVRDEQGNLYAAGKKNKDCWIVALNEKGIPQWEVTVPQEEASEARSLIVNNNAVYATGYSKGKRNPTLLLVKIKEGQTEWQKSWKDMQGMDLKLLSNQQLVIGGSTFERGEDMVLLKTDLDGEELAVNTFGGRGDDGANAVYPDWNKIQYLLGFSFSHLRAARREKLWIAGINEAGKEVWEERQFFGGDFRDKGYDVLQLHNGDLVLAGVTHSNSIKDTDAWLIKLKGQPIPKVGTVPTLKITPTGFPSNNSILPPSSSTYYTATITNEGNEDAYNIIATADATTQKGVDYLKELHIGWLPAGATKYIHFPISTNEEVSSGDNTFTYTFSEANSAVLSPISFSINSEQHPQPNLVITKNEFQVTENLTYAKKDSPITLEVLITNQGNGVAENVKIKFSSPYKTTALSENLIEVGNLSPQSSKQVSFTFQAEDIYLAETIEVSCRIIEKTSKYGSTERYTIELDNTLPTKSEDIQEVTIQQQQFLLLNWSAPNPALYGTTSLVWEQDKIPITLIANSTDTITENQFKVFINGKDRSSIGAKMDKVKMVVAKDKDASGKNIFTHTFVSDINLAEGDNEIYVEVTNDAGTVKSEVLNVNYAPLKPNLYLVSIGVPQIDLQFTQKDAGDFANAFLYQEGKLFNKVIFHKVLNKPANTTARAISYAISEIERAEQEDQLLEKDVLILFFSTHGMTDNKNKSYLLFPSDVDRLDVRGTAVHFGYDIVDRLQSIKCKKFFFVDACRSEAYNGDTKNLNFSSLDEAIFSLAASQASVKTMLSCSQGESSYEDKSWNNGAFTKVLVEGLNNQTFKGSQGEFKTDTNRDNIITFDELFNYVKLRVPLLVQKTKGKEHQQTPTLPEQHKGGDLPIYYIKN